MLEEVYHVFGLTFKAALSTRPESRMGEESQWDKAETALREALEAQQQKAGHEWEVMPTMEPPAMSLPQSNVAHWHALLLWVRLALQCQSLACTRHLKSAAVCGKGVLHGYSQSTNLVRAKRLRHICAGTHTSEHPYSCR